MKDHIVLGFLGPPPCRKGATVATVATAAHPPLLGDCFVFSSTSKLSPSALRPKIDIRRAITDAVAMNQKTPRVNAVADDGAICDSHTIRPTLLHATANRMPSKK